MLKTTNDEIIANDARGRLVSSALRLFAEKGYEAASTREICEAAGVNISSIRYYFGDKAGLYRAVFTEPVGETSCGADIGAYAHLPLSEAFIQFFAEFLEPLKKGEALGLVMKLHYREMIEPTGIWLQMIDGEIKPQHHALVARLQTHLELPEIDIDLHRLAFAIVGMAVHFYVGQDIVAAICAPMLNTPQAVDILAERLSAYAVAMVEGEAARRAQGGIDSA